MLNRFRATLRQEYRAFKNATGKAWNNILSERTVTSELTINSVLVMYFIAIVPDRNDQTSGAIRLLEEAFAIELWLILMFFAFSASILGNLFERLSWRKYGSMINIMIWGYVVAGFTFLAPVFSLTTTGIFFIFLVSSMWSYLSIQNEIRLSDYGRKTMTVTINKSLLHDLEKQHAGDSDHKQSI